MTHSPPTATSSPPSQTAVPRAGRLRLTLLALCSTGGALAAVVLPAVLGNTVDELLARGEPVWSALLLCTALTAAEALFDAVVAVVGGTTTAELTARLRVAVVQRVTGCEPRHGQSVTAGDLTTRLTANAAEAAGVPVITATAVASVLMPLGGVAGLLLVDAWTALALFVAAPALVVLLRTLVRDTAQVSADYQSEQARIAGRLTEVLDGIATVRAAHTATREQARITGPLTELDAHGRRTWQIQGRAAAGAAALLPVLTAVVLAVAGIRTAAGALSVGALLAVSQYAVLAVGFGSLTGSLSAISRGRAAARRLEPLLALPPVPHRSLTLPPGGPGTLELRGVDVVRDGERLLNGVDLTVPGGTATAVVGRSGSGKSLLAAVAGRLTDPDAGSVTLDGVPLDGIDPDELRDQVAHAFARPVLLGTTVEDAVGYGDPRPSGDRVRDALRDASAEPFVALLPLGARTPLEQAPLSGGECQRLGLARAFARPARLLILDDATSSLDTVTESQVQAALARRAGTVTRLIVAHRVSTAASADQVVWLDRGEVRAIAPHATLWHHPDYRALFHQNPRPAPPQGGSGPTAPVPEAGTRGPAVRVPRPYGEPPRPAPGGPGNSAAPARPGADGEGPSPAGPERAAAGGPGQGPGAPGVAGGFLGVSAGAGAASGAAVPDGVPPGVAGHRSGAVGDGSLSGVPGRVVVGGGPGRGFRVGVPDGVPPGVAGHRSGGVGDGSLSGVP
ncbi:ABC transporter ATP-binding protein, partial [Streptomyces clavuligerus]